jgi:hypothetical protein
MTDCSFFVRRMGGTSVCSSAGKQTLAPPGAPRAQIPRTGISIGLSQQCGRPRPQQRVLQKAGAHTCSVSDFIFDMVDMIDMIDTIWTSRLPRIARRESGAATRAQRGSCHRTPNCARPSSVGGVYAAPVAPKSLRLRVSALKKEPNNERT